MRRRMQVRFGSISARSAEVEETAALRVDVAFLDVNLEDGKSYAIADALMAVGVPFVFVTEDSKIAEWYRHAPVLQKPITDEDLLATIHMMLWLEAAI